MSAVLVAAPADKPISVSVLRDDLKLLEAAPHRDGSPSWVVHDPVQNRFFKIGMLEFELLSRWSLQDPRLIAVAVRQDTLLKPSLEQVMEFDQFLRQHELVRAINPTDVNGFLARAEKARQSFGAWLLHNYLFIRIPLLRPGQFFKRSLPAVAWAFTPGFWWLTVVAGLAGLMLVARQWDGFVHTVSNHFTVSGLLAYAVALMVAKTLHECGHAFAATRHGCRVAHMGVAFLVMWPMLYTDTGEAWKLRSRKHRLQIAAAGMAVEFALAAWATLAWALAPDSPLRDALFFLASTSWLLTLALNASPFMRFDGYFLLSDALDIPNLHARSGELARAFVRRSLLGTKETVSDAYNATYSPALRRGLIAFALVTWLYRLVVFIGIALAVYYFFFKLLGIFLFIVEIAWFIVRPIWSEVKHWPQHVSGMSWKRRVGLGVLLGAVLALLLIPFDHTVKAPGWLHAERQHAVYSPLAGRVVSLAKPGPASAGSSLAVLDAPDLRNRSTQSLLAEQALLRTLDQLIGVAEGQERRASLLQQVAQQRAEAQAQAAELKRLELLAPFGGLLLDLDPELRPGAWVNPGQAIGVLIDPSSWIVEALVEQSDLARIEVGARAKIYQPGRLERGYAAKVIAVDSSRAQVLPHAMLSVDHGGQLVTVKQANGQLAPRNSLYRVRLQLIDPAPRGVHSVAPSHAVIEGQRRSLAASWLTSALSVVLRESGF